MRNTIATMSSVLGCLSLLAGCAVMPPESAEAQSDTTPAAVSLAEPDVPMQRAAPWAATPIARPAVHISTTTRSAPASARRLEAVPSRFVEQTIASGIGVTPLRTTTPGKNEDRSAAPGNAAIKVTYKTQPGPDWLKACQHRQQQAAVIMCDADSLLAPPSDKVMVYVRDAKLSGKQANGQRIALRESLPRLYRLFVLD